MNLSVCEFVAASLVRRTLIIRGDVRADVAFQNDINALMAQIEEEPVPFHSVSGLTSYSVDWLEKISPKASFGVPPTASRQLCPVFSNCRGTNSAWGARAATCL